MVTLHPFRGKRGSNPLEGAGGIQVDRLRIHVGVPRRATTLADRA
jgi:hypothetical protein